MTAIFRSSANLAATLTLLILAGLFVGGIGWWWLWPRTDYVRHVGWTVRSTGAVQPPASCGGPGDRLPLLPHLGRGIIQRRPAADLYLHDLPFADLDQRRRCWRRCAQSLADDKPIVWHRVTDLPDYVYFNHSIHIAKGVGCSSCHGEVDRMPLTLQGEDPHHAVLPGLPRDPGPQLRPKDQIYNTEWQRTADTPSPEALMAQYHVGGRNLTDCSICHR